MDNSTNPNERRVYRQQEVVEYGNDGLPLVPQPVAPPYRDGVVDARSTSADYGDAQMDNYQRTYVDEAGNVMERQEQVFNDNYTRRQNILNRTNQIIYLLAGALEMLLVLRFVFRLLGADQANGIVNFLYNLSSPFIIAFNGIFSDYKIGTNSVLELSTLIAMALYALLTWGVIALINTLFSPNPSSRRVVTSTRRRQ